MFRFTSPSFSQRNVGHKLQFWRGIMIKDQTDNIIIAKETTKDPREALNICLKKKSRSVVRLIPRRRRSCALGFIKGLL